ncbi:peptidoglycan D,D-transpeptidase FtsI family protein [Paenibacillus sp. y28]|uniref:peptidoglycan D,D-transpeptidase FtsI family protein n=1 Tax=Paenibacillus sp. y28 TaxID=3129110 RepID=UPI0030185118
MNLITNGDDPQKKELQRKRHFSFRLNLFFFATFALFSILIVRLAMLQFVQGAELKRQELYSTEKPTPIAPIRGNIYDHNGYAIATTTPTQSLFFRMESGQKLEEIKDLAYRLEQIFNSYGSPGKGQMTAADIVKKMDFGKDIEGNEARIITPNSVPRRIKADLSKQEMAYFVEHRDEFKWIEITEESIRTYNTKRIAVQLVGYLRQFSAAREPKNGLPFYKNIASIEYPEPTLRYIDNEEVGYDGIELLYQEDLRGLNGVKSYPVNASNKIIGQVTITPPKKGNNLYLTIDKDVQLTAQQAILDNISEINKAVGNSYKYAPSAKMGFAVAMEVDTGRVVAMASMPDYDPTVWQGGTISSKDYSENEFYLRNGTISEVRPKYKEQADLNKHATSLVYLGSTIKPLSVLVGLNEKLFGPYERYNDTGIFEFGKDKSTISNSDGKAYGSINASEAIWHSSNTFMSAMIGQRLFQKQGGLDIWDSYMKQFGLGTLTGSGLRGESEGILDYVAEAKKASAQSALIRSSWGQMGKYTTLQLAQYTAMLGNRGKRMKPIFVEKMTTTDGQIVKTIEPEVLNEVNMPKEYWDIIESGMVKVFKTGFDGVTYSVATKTGTSTQSIAGKLIDNAVFIAYAPVEKPKLAVAVVVPEGGYGAYGAAPIARKIFDAYDQYFGLNGVPKAGSVQEGPQTQP